MSKPAKPAPVDYPIHPALQGRWSTVSFSDQAVAPEHIRSILEAARWAPSAFNEQPWRFLVADRARDGEGHALFADLLMDFNRRWAPRAPLLVLSVISERLERGGKPNAAAAHDVGLATAQLIAQATALGLVVHPMGGFDADRAVNALGIPEGFRPMVMLAIGHPEPADGLPEDLKERELSQRSRRPQEEIAFASSWERPLRTAADRE